MYVMQLNAFAIVLASVILQMIIHEKYRSDVYTICGYIFAVMFMFFYVLTYSCRMLMGVGLCFLLLVVLFIQRKALLRFGTTFIPMDVKICTACMVDAQRSTV